MNNLIFSYKNKLSDFRVKECLDFDFSNQGEHLIVKLRKKDLNTNEVALILAKHLNISLKDVSFSGMKDKNAITYQYFSIRTFQTLNFDHPSIIILEQHRHHKKLKRGSHSRNYFSLVLRDINDIELFKTRLLAVQRHGFVNYFGSQRFGYQNFNLTQAKKMLDGVKFKRHKKSIYLSAVKAYIFNYLVKKRISEGHHQIYLNDTFR